MLLCRSTAGVFACITNIVALLSLFLFLCTSYCPRDNDYSPGVANATPSPFVFPISLSRADQEVIRQQLARRPRLRARLAQAERFPLPRVCSRRTYACLAQRGTTWKLKVPVCLEEGNACRDKGFVGVTVEL